MTFALVVEEAGVPWPMAPLPLSRRPEPFVIGRSGQADLRIARGFMNPRNCGIAHDGGGFVVVDYGGSNGVWVNGERVERQHRVQPGDALWYQSIRVRFVAVDPFAALVRCGPWVLSGATQHQPPWRGPCFTVDGSGRRGFVVCVDDDGDVALAARAAGEAPALPALIDRVDVGAAVARVFDVDDGVDADRFIDRAAPVPASVAVRLLKDVADALAVQEKICGRPTRAPHVVVGFDGRVQLVPLLAPFVARPGEQPQHWRLLFALARAHPALMDLVRGRVVEADVGAAAADLLGAGPAEDVEVAAVVRGLFSDEHRAVRERREQELTLDDDAVDRLTGRA